MVAKLVTAKKKKKKNVARFQVNDGQNQTNAEAVAKS